MLARLRILLTLALIGACGRADAQTSPSIVVLEARDAIVRGATLYAVDPDATTLRAIALDTGAVRFTASLGPRAEGAIVHDLGAGHVLVQTSQRFVTIDTARGAVVATRDTAPGWQFVWRAAGACALRSECTLAPIDCRTGAPIGPPLRGTYIHRTPIDESFGRATTSCRGDFDVLGRAGALSLYVAGPLGAPIRAETREIIAIDRAGEVAWHRADVGCEACARFGAGMAPDGSLCWTTESGEHTRTLTAFDCADGAIRWRRSVSPPSPYRDPEMLTAWVPGHGLLVLESLRARLFSPEGRVRFTRATTSSTVLVPEGAVFPAYALSLPAFETITHVEASRGTTLRDVDAAGRVARIDEAGHLAFAPGESGSERGGGPAGALARFHFARAPTGSHASIDDRVVLTIPGDGWALGEHVTQDVAVLAVLETREGMPDRIHVVRVGR